MWAASGLEASYERVVVGLQEQHPWGVALCCQLVERTAKLAEERARAHIGDHGDPALVGAIEHRVNERQQQRRRDVVDDEPPKVVQRRRGGGLTRAGQPGQQQQLGFRWLTAGHDASFLSWSTLFWSTLSWSASTISPVLVLTAGSRRRPARASTTACAVERPTPGTSATCSTVAARIRRTLPNSANNAARRVGPRPGTSSRALPVMLAERRLRCSRTATRWASSRTRCSRYRPSLERARMIGSSTESGQTSSRRLARPTTGMSAAPAASIASRAAAT